MQGQIWPIVTRFEVNLTQLGLAEASALTKIENKAYLNRSKIRFLETRVKLKKLENLKFFGPGILWDRPSGVAIAVVRIADHYRGRNGSLMPIGHKGRFLLFENRKKLKGNNLNRTTN